MYYLCTAKSEQGTLAERLGNGLQNRVEQFDSARYLDLEPRKTFFRGSFIIHTSCCHSPTKLFAILYRTMGCDTRNTTTWIIIGYSH